MRAQSYAKRLTKNADLAVMNKERAVFKSPQAVLDALQGKLTFDPLAFANMKEVEQRDMLLKMTGLGANNPFTPGWISAAKLPGLRTSGPYMSRTWAGSFEISVSSGTEACMR